MNTKQQVEALDYFEANAGDWNNKALSKSKEKVNVIRQRNSYVLQVIDTRPTTASSLDVGCGPGDLVCDTARKGIEAFGVDFAGEMIEIATKKAKDEQLTNAYFACCSIFDFSFPKALDLISANGFIEYISYEQLHQFLDLSYQALDPGGSLVLGSRNRLFNVFGLNSFTREELNTGTALLLLRESVALCEQKNITEIMEMESAPLQRPESNHSRTGVSVSTRYQFTPVQLAKILTEKGYRIEAIHPIHYHAAPTIFKDRNPQAHARTSNFLQSYADLSLVPYSSSFMLHAKKGEAS